MAAIRKRAGTSERGLLASGAVPCGACVVILMLMGSGPRFLHRELKGRLANASPSRLLNYIQSRHWKFHGPAGTASRAPQVPGRSIARAVALPARCEASPGRTTPRQSLRGRQRWPASDGHTCAVVAEAAGQALVFEPLASASAYVSAAAVSGASVPVGGE